MLLLLLLRSCCCISLLLLHWFLSGLMLLPGFGFSVCVSLTVDVRFCVASSEVIFKCVYLKLFCTARLCCLQAAALQMGAVVQ